MTASADRIAGIALEAQRSTIAADEAIRRLSGAAQTRGGPAGRRADGAFFTDHDVARYLVRRAIVAALLDTLPSCSSDVDELLASGDDLHAALTDAVSTPGAIDAARARLEQLQVLDPTCGAGAFLVAAWQELEAVCELLAARPPRLDQLHGVDVDEGAVAACRATLAIVAGAQAGEADIALGDAQVAAGLPRADIIVGNPPFVRARADVRHDDLTTRSVPNRSAWIVERALAAAAPGARIAFVLPISTVCVDAFAPAREAWERACDRIHATHFDTIPSSLFEGVVQRITLLEGRRRRSALDASAARWWTSRFHRWRRDERADLLAAVRHVAMPPVGPGGSIPKVGTAIETRLLARVQAQPPAGRWFASAGARRDAPNQLHYKRRWSYFLLFTDFMPGIWNADGSERAPSEFKTVDVAPGLDARVLLAAYSSTLFWWWFSVFTDNRNVNRRDLAAFPLPDLDDAAAARIAALGTELMVALRDCSEVRTCTYRSIGTIHNTYFRQAATRPVLDRIDRELAAAYAMPADELEFVLDYERRFRS